MSSNSRKYPMHKHGSALATRDLGSEVARELHAAGKNAHLFIVDFQEVRVASSPFLDEVVIALRSMIADRPDRHVLLCGVNEDLRDTLLLVVERRDIVLTTQEPTGDLRPLGGSRYLEQTLAEAQQLGVFTAPQLAERLDLKLPNLHQRLAQLEAAGALTRQDDPDVERGRRLLFKTPETTDPRGPEPVRA